MTPPVVIWPILLPLFSVNQRAPSGPTVMKRGTLPAVGTVNSVKTPPVVIRSIMLWFSSVNHRAPSGPAMMPKGLLLPVGSVNSVMTPPTVIWPILPICSVNQRAPSGPAVISAGELLAVGTGNSLGVGPQGSDSEAEAKLGEKRAMKSSYPPPFAACAPPVVPGKSVEAECPATYTSPD